MKTVTFDDEAYKLLRAAKLTPKESFSHVVKRMLNPRRDALDAAFGAWANMTDEEVRRLREETIEDFGWTGP